MVIKKASLLVLRIIFVLGVLTWIIIKYDPNITKDILNTANLIWLLLASVFFALTLFFYAWRWRVIIHGFWQDVKVSIASLYWYNLLALFYSLFIPTTITVEAVRIIRLSRKTGNDYPKSTISAILDRIVGGAIWFIVFLICPTPFRSKKFYLLFILLAVGFYFLRKKIILWEHRVFDFSRHHPRDIIKGITLSIIGQSCYVLVNYFVFLCFGINLTLLQAAGIACISVMASLIPISCFGLGLKEGSYIGLLPLYGVTSTQAFLVTTFFVLMNYIFGLTGGIIELAHTGWKFSRLRISEEVKSEDTETIGKELGE